MAEANPLSFIFGGNTGTPTYQELLRRRAIATAQAGRQRKMPTTLGEGMTYLGEAVGDRLESNRLSEAERAFGAAEDKRLADPLREPSPYGPAARGSAAAAPAPVLDAGSPAPSAARDRIAMALNGVPQEVASLDPTLGAATPPGFQSEEARWNARTGKSDDDPVWSARQAAIGGIESSDDYRAVGVPTKYGRALGRYGVMEVNVAPWTQAALGRPMTPQEFLANDKAQDAVFRHRFGQLVAKHGEEKAARAWYGGEGNINNLNAMDAHEKLTVRDYGQDYVRRLRGKRAEAGEEASAPVQIAAGGGPTGTMSDAPPPGLDGGRMMPPPPRPGSEAPEENDPTITEDIQPMSVRTQIAQAPAGMISGSVAGVPGVAMGPNQPPLPAPPGAPAGASVVPADLPPSLTPIPPASEQVMRDPGAEPKAPERLDFSPRQRAWMKVINNRNSSDYAKEYAQSQFNLEEKVRTEMSARQNEAYRDQRERWQQRKTAYDTHVMKKDERTIDQLNKRLAAEDAQRKLVVMAPLEERIKASEAALKQAEADGIPDAIAKRKIDLDKANVDYAIAVRTLNKPETVTLQGTQFERPYDPKGGTLGPLTRTPGAPEPEEKPLTAEQAEGVRFVLRTKTDLEQIEKMDHGKVLTEATEAIPAGIPGVGNWLASEKHRAATNKLGNWAGGFLKLTSGAAVTPSEAMLQLPAFVPRVGDDAKELAEKSRRRREFTEAVEKTTGARGLEVIRKATDAVNEEYLESKRPPVPVSNPDEARAMEAAGTLKPGRMLLLPDGRTIRVPRR